MMNKVNPFPEPLPGPDHPPAPYRFGMIGCGGVPSNVIPTSCRHDDTEGHWSSSSRPMLVVLVFMGRGPAPEA